MWRDVLPALAAAGFHALAPDLPGYGDSAGDPPGTGSATSRRSSASAREPGLERVALVVHDWGGLIGLRWACDHPDAVARARHLRHRLLRRRQVARPRRDPAHRGPGRAVRRAASTARASPQMLGAVSTGIDARRRRRVLQGVRRRGPPQRPARALPLGRLREARALRGQARAARRADAAAVGRRRLRRAGGRRASLREARSPARRSWCSTAPGTSWSRTRRTATPRSWCASSRRRARARHAELVVALVALVDRAGGVDVDGQRSAPSGTAGPGPRRARARPARARAPAAGVSVVPSTEHDDVERAGRRAAAVDDGHQVAGVRAVGAGLGLDAERAQVGAEVGSGGRPPRSTSPTRRGDRRRRASGTSRPSGRRRAPPARSRASCRRSGRSPGRSSATCRSRRRAACASSARRPSASAA